MNPIDSNRLLQMGVAKAATLFVHSTVPTEQDLKAGNYEKGLISIKGLRISIENPRGSIRSGDDWIVAMVDHYGYINGVRGADGDDLDVYVNDMNFLDEVYVIDQVVDGNYDESIVMIGYRDQDHAFDNYMQNFDASWPKEGHKVFKMSWSDLISWTMLGDTTKPCAVWMASSYQKLRDSTKRLRTSLSLD